MKETPPIPESENSENNCETDVSQPNPPLTTEKCEKSANIKNSESRKANTHRSPKVNAIYDVVFLCIFFCPTPATPVSLSCTIKATSNLK